MYLPLQAAPWPAVGQRVSCGPGLVSGSAVVQVSRGDLGPALWELVRAQENRSPTAGHDEAWKVKKEEAGYKRLRVYRLGGGARRVGGGVKVAICRISNCTRK